MLPSKRHSVRIQRTQSFTKNKELLKLPAIYFFGLLYQVLSRCFLKALDSINLVLFSLLYHPKLDSLVITSTSTLNGCQKEVPCDSSWKTEIVLTNHFFTCFLTICRLSNLSEIYWTFCFLGVTGVWPESESFKDDDMGPIPSKWKGICHNNDTQTPFHCNKSVFFSQHHLSI